MDVKNKKNADDIKMKSFHNLKCKAYPYERLNTSNGVVRSRELSLATPEEIDAALGKQGIANCRRISKKKGKINKSEFVDTSLFTYAYILTFNKSSIPKEIKMGFTIEWVEQYI